MVVAVKLTAPDGGKVVELQLDDYVAAVLAGESSVFRSDEALKAMSIAARTYAVRLRGRHSKEGFDFCATTHCQRAAPKAVTARLQSIADTTSGEMLWFEGRPAYATYTRDCGGRSEDARAVWPDVSEPYLKSHEDPYCLRSGGSRWQWVGSSQEIVNALKESGLRSPPVLSEITVAKSTASGRAQTLMLGGTAINASSFQLALGRVLGWDTLRSTHFHVRRENGRFDFEGSGYGHGAGLCQVGADRMGTEGHSYREILDFYYPGTLVGLNGRGLKWTHLGGELVTVLSTQPDQDGAVVRQADQLVRSLSAQTKLTPPARVEIRIYPDLETYLNASGAGGSVAGFTRGSRIDLQPARLLRSRGVFDSTLRHELLHVLVENRIRPGVPVPAREKIVECLERNGATQETCATRIQDATKSR